MFFEIFTMTLCFMGAIILIRIALMILVAILEFIFDFLD